MDVQQTLSSFGDVSFDDLYMSTQSAPAPIPPVPPQPTYATGHSTPIAAPAPPPPVMPQPTYAAGYSAPIPGPSPPKIAELEGRLDARSNATRLDELVVTSEKLRESLVGSDEKIASLQNEITGAIAGQIAYLEGKIAAQTARLEETIAAAQNAASTDIWKALEIPLEKKIDALSESIKSQLREAVESLENKTREILESDKVQAEMESCHAVPSNETARTESAPGNDVVIDLSDSDEDDQVASSAPPSKRAYISRFPSLTDLVNASRGEKRPKNNSTSAGNYSEYMPPRTQTNKGKEKNADESTSTRTYLGHIPSQTQSYGRKDKKSFRNEKRSGN